MDKTMRKRFVKFSVELILHLKTYRNNVENNILKQQLIKSATSIGANYEEAQAASSKKDFLAKMRISLREARESNYWLKILKEIEEMDDEKLDCLLAESNEITRILGAICSSTSKSLISKS